MEILAILEDLEDLVERSVNVPFTGKCLVDKEEVLELIKEMRLHLPEDIKQAKWVKEERQRILHEAQQDANNILKDAENRINSMVDQNEITRLANERANEIINNAQKNAREIRQGTREYADGLLAKLQDTLRETIEILEANRKELNSGK